MNDQMTIDAKAADLTQLTADIACAYVTRNNVPPADLPALLHNVHSALGRLGGAPATIEDAAEPLKPAVSIRKSITDDYLISLENGRRFKSLKRHLMTSYNMTPQQYRERWGLPKEYPMVAPAYAASRSALAKNLGLGRKAMQRPFEAKWSVTPIEAPTPAKRAGRPKKAAAVAE